jgi:BirA family transcriptional regulator, biotin operon repressor / biotin---[acetyl-CoA-carboxylase] ligase
LCRALTEGDDASWRHLDVVARTGSTNADLAARARAGEAAGAVLVAEHQVSGRGRRDRTWESPARAGLAVSVLLRPSAPAGQWAWLTLLAGVAVVDAVRRTAALDATLKWPNDVLVPTSDASGAERAKIAGLLAEVVPTPSGHAVVLGVGLNVSQDGDELPVPTATSLRLAGAATTDRDPVLRAVLRELAARYRDWEAAAGDPERCGLAGAYRERCSTIGAAVSVHLPDGSTLEGVAEGVDDAGRLLVRPAPPGPGAVAPPVRALSAGDVLHVRPAGSTGSAGSAGSAAGTDLPNGRAERA